MNILQAHLRQSVITLLGKGISHREIARRLEINRKTVGLIAKALSKRAKVATDVEPIDGSNSHGVPTDCEGLAANAPTPATGASSSSDQNGPGWPPVPPRSLSACEAHREWIEEQVGLGRHAMSIYLELVDRHGFGNQYNSVKRFVSSLKHKDPERFDVLEFAPGVSTGVEKGL